MRTNDDERKQDSQEPLDGKEPLDANLAKLIHKDNLPPSPSEAQKKAMLERLRRKQVALRQPSTVKQTTRPLALHPLALAAMAAAVIVLVCVFALFPRLADLSLSSRDSGAATPNPGTGIPTAVEPPAISEPITHDAGERTRRIALRDGSTAIAEQGTRFTEVAPRNIVLETGSLYLLVAKADTPLEVETAQGKVLALGTRFLVTSKADDTRVAVAQGKVQLVRAGDSQQLDLSRGEEGILASRELLKRPAPRLTHLVGWAQGALRQREIIDESAVRPSGLIAVDPNGQESRLSLREYTLDVFIEGGVARTTIDQTFFNHHPANTEGTFYFPLPPGAAVSRMAMYVNGVRNEAGMVERQRGQEIYNDIKYAKRDPALLEQLEGNFYKLRIFPLEARQEKRIFISCTQSVDELYRTLRYRFPMDHTQERAGRLRIKIRIKHGEELFDAESGTHQFVKTVEDGDLLLSYEAENIKPDQDLLLKLIPKGNLDQIAGTATLTREGNHYLHTRIRPDLQGKVDPRPRQWFVLNDTSGSRSGADLKAQAHIVARLLAEGDDGDLIALSNLNIDATRLTGQLVPLRGEEASQAIERIRSAERIGATNLAAGIASVRAWITKSGAENPHIIYLGDGLVTDGQTTSRELTAMLDKDVPFIGIAVGKKADLSFLRAAANATGGAALLMNPEEDLNWRVFDLLASFNTPRLRGIHWEFPGAPEGITAYANRATLSAGEALTLVAVSKNEIPKQVIIRGELDGQQWEKTVALDEAREDAGFIPRFWAQRHLEELLEEGEEHREEIVRLSKKHYVATPFTSLIVLENDEMYARYKVEKGRKDHWAAYPAPEKIPVVREPLRWTREVRQEGLESQGDDGEITLDPKTAEEIVETLLPTTARLDGFLYTAEGYKNLGLYDEAVREYQRVLRIDPFHSSARRGLEEIHRLKSHYYRAAYDETRARLLTQVDQAWELAVPPPGGDLGGINLSGPNLWMDTQGATPVEVTHLDVASLQRHYQDAPWGTYLFSSPNLDFGEVGSDFTSLRGAAWSQDYAFAPEIVPFGTTGLIAPGDVDPYGVIDPRAFRPASAVSGTLGSFYDPWQFTPQAGYRYHPAPVSYPLVGNLTTMVPALTTTANDRASAVEMKLGREKAGSISEEAKALVQTAEGKRKPVRINGTITTPDGRMTGSATSPMHLKEETISDGKSWFHIYRELGFATRRPVTPSNLAAIQGVVPHWPPSLSELEAGWLVTLGAVGEGWFEIVLVDPEDQERKRILKISTEGLLMRARHFKGEKLVGSRSFSYEGDEVVITSDSGIVRRYEAVPVEVDDALFVADLDDLVVLDLPLRKPIYYEKLLASSDEGTIKERKQILRHLITAKLRDVRVVTQRPPAVAPPVRVPTPPAVSPPLQADPIPEPVPAPSGAAAVVAPRTAKAAWNHLIQLGDGSTPLFDHLTLAAALSIESVGPESGDFLIHLKELTALGLTGSPARQSVEAFLENWPESPYVLPLVQRCRDPRVWIALLDLPPYQAAAIAEISKVAGSHQWPDRDAIATRIATLLIADAKEGRPAVITARLAHFLGREQRNNGDWRKLVACYQDLAADLAKLKPRAVAALLDVAIKEKDDAMEQRCLDHLLTAIEERKQAAEFVMIADLFSSHGRHEKAMALYKRALAGHKNPSAGLLQKAAASAQGIDENLSIVWQHRALRKLGEERRDTDSQQLSEHYASLLSRAIAVGDLTTARQIAIEGYELLTNQHALITQVAAYYHEKGDETERWRWLSTIIDRNPKNADGCGAIGDWYENQNLLKEAAAKFAEAHSYDSAHPRWLVKQVGVLYRAGNFEQADSLYRELITTSWASQLRREVPQEYRILLSDPDKPGKFTGEEPGEGWHGIAFDDRAWKERTGKFRADESDAEFWDSPVYLRQKFQVARKPRRVALQAGVHGVECDVYLNGVFVHHLEEKGLKANGADRPYTVSLPQEIMDTLAVGENVVSLRCKKIGKKPRAYVELVQLFSKPE